MRGTTPLPFGSFSADVVRMAVGLVLLPAVAILGLSLAMVGMLPPPGAWVFPPFFFLGGGLLAGGLHLLLAPREHHRIARKQALFVVQAGHELRTPLATLQVVAAELSFQPQQAELARRLASAAENLSRGIERLLDGARLTSGRLSLRLEPVRLGEVLQEAERLAWPRLRSQGQSLVRQGEAECWVGVTGLRWFRRFRTCWLTPASTPLRLREWSWGWGRQSERSSAPFTAARGWRRMGWRVSV